MGTVFFGGGGSAPDGAALLALESASPDSTSSLLPRRFEMTDLRRCFIFFIAVRFAATLDALLPAAVPAAVALEAAVAFGSFFALVVGAV